MMRLPSIAAACALSLIGLQAAAQDVSTTSTQQEAAAPAKEPGTEQPLTHKEQHQQEAAEAKKPGTAGTAQPQISAERAGATLDAAPPKKVTPKFAIGEEDYYFKPILAIAGGIHDENLIQSLNPNKEDRLTTVALTRFGAEGKAGKYVTFRSEFERNLRAHGSGVWEGTASFSVRDQWVRVSRWGASAEVGIVLDPASVDYFSAHVGDVLIADRYTRDPLLYSGFNRGQGVQASYEWQGLRAGLSYTAANPLSTTSSFEVGGTFGGGSRLWERPLGNFRVGQPDDDLHFQVVSPSLIYAHEYFEVKAAAQFFNVNYQVNSRTDPRITGYNLRGAARGKIKLNVGLPLVLVPFFNAARITNDVTNSTPGYADTLLETRFTALTLSGGLDLNINGRSGLGVWYANVSDDNPTFVAPTATAPAQEPITETTQQYLNIGATHWFTDEVALGARYARYWKHPESGKNESDSSIFITLRMVL